MSARITLIFIALVVGMVFCTATDARPPTDEPLVKSSVAPDDPKWWPGANFGTIAQLYPHRGGVYFTLRDGQTTMEPHGGYYLLKTSPIPAKPGWGLPKQYPRHRGYSVTWVGSRGFPHTQHSM